MDVPGRDPVVFLWVWWVSLALSHSFSLCHSPCGFLYNHLYCPPTTPLQVCLFLAVMAGDCDDEISSKSQTAISRHHIMRESSESSRFLLLCTLSSIFELRTVLFVLFSMNFTNVPQIRLSVNVFPKSVCNFQCPNFFFLQSLSKSRDYSLNSLNVPSLH